MSSNGYESELISEVIAVCNDLGHKNKLLDNKYILNKKDSNNDIKDLIRFLRNDDKNKFSVRKQLGFSNVVQNDLIPIVEQYSLEDIPLFDKVLRLLVDLTNPTILHFKSKTPNDKMESQKFIELQTFLFSYKLSFGSNKKFWTVLAKHLTRILAIDEENLQMEDSYMFERILILIRNILHIPIDTDMEVMTSEEYTNPHDRILDLLHTSGITDVILHLCRDGSHHDYCFHLIEIISLIFREQNAEFVAKSVANYQQNSGSNDDRRSNYEREVDRKELMELKIRDKNKLSKCQTNYNRFNGTYFVKDMKSISDRDIIYHKTPINLSQISFDSNKPIKRKAKNRKPMIDTSTTKSSSGSNVIHKSTIKVRKILYEFCCEFLNDSYNQFMRQIRDNLMRKTSLDNDETYYLWAIQFFMEFNRCNPNTTDNTLVSETMTLSSFHYLHTQIEHYLDFIKTQKEDQTLWSKRLHYGLKAYRELLFSLNYFDSVRDERIRTRAQLIKRDVFYEVDYRDLLLDLLHDYNEVKMSNSFLKDLIETNHVFLKLLEKYTKTSRLLVKEKLRKRKKKKSQKKKPIEKTPPEEVWNEIMSTVSEALQGNIELPSPEEDVSVRAFDSTSDKSTDEQKMDVLRRVHNFLEQKRVVEAIALYRDARNCWSGDDDNAFGAHDILPEEELLSLNEVLMTEFPKESTNEEQNENPIEEEEEEEVTNEESVRTRERELGLSEVINKYCHPIVIRNYGLLLRSYDTNSDETNHCIVKMLHRIAFDCKMHAMLFQASLFRTFQRILSDPLRDSPSIKELSKFAKFIVSKFAFVAQNNKKVFMELFFWKSCREAYEIEEGYDANHTKTKQLWTEEQELELNVLFNEYKDKTDGDKDVVDLILDHLMDETKTRRQVIIQLKRQDLFTQIKSKKQKRILKSERNGNSGEKYDSSSDDDNNEELNALVVDNDLQNNTESNENINISDFNDVVGDQTNDEINEKISDINVNVLDESSNSSVVLQIDETIETNDNQIMEYSDDEQIVVKKKKRRIMISDDEED